MIAANTIVGSRYRVLRALGGGGMKLVYLAEDLRLAARRCALAEMVDSFTSADAQKQAVAAFQREANMLAQLSNEHIPRVFDCFSEANHHYLVMEYIDGVTLEDELRKNGGKLPPARVIDTAIQILDTLEYLHNLAPPVIYRDLKPSNVMLAAEGRAKLIDFGIARHFQPLVNATMIGTQGYAPPEQYRGRVEIRSDLYALGATMHHALSGRDPAAEPPFSFPPLRKLCPDIAGGLAAVVDQALAYDVVNRIPDASEFKRRLLKVTADSSSTAAMESSSSSSTIASADTTSRPQPRLPLGADASSQAAATPQTATPRPAAASASNGPSAPTVLSLANDIKCPTCGRTIPLDSHFCSYCAADLGWLGDARANPAADTVVLSSADPEPPSSGVRPNADIARRRASRPRTRRARRRRIMLLVAIFVLSFVAMKISRAINENAAPAEYGSSAEDPRGFAPAIPPSDDDEIDDSSTRLAAFRAALDASGYTKVRFRVEGDTMDLWGSVPTLHDRAMVQMLCVTTTGIYSLRDRLKVDNAGLGG